MAMKRPVSEEEYKRRKSGLSVVNQFSPAPSTSLDNTQLTRSHGSTPANSTVMAGPMMASKQNTRLLADPPSEQNTVREFGRQLQIPTKNLPNVSLNNKPSAPSNIQSPSDTIEIQQSQQSKPVPDTGLQPITDTTLPSGDRKVSLSQLDGGSGEITVHGGIAKRPMSVAENRFRNAVPGDNSGTRAQQKRQFDARQSFVGTRRRFGPAPTGKSAGQQMPRFDAPGFTGAAKAARIHSQEQQWLKERRGAADTVARDSAGQSAQTVREAMDNATSLAMSRDKNRTSIATNKASNETSRENALAGQEADRQKLLAAQAKPAIDQKGRAKFRKEASEEYRKYASNPDLLTDPLSREEWISQTYDPETLAIYGYENKPRKNTSAGNDPSAYIDSLLN